jgi:hypothetical protein
MAGHLPLVTTDFHVKLVEEFKNNRALQTAKFFDRIRIKGFEGYFQRLPQEYDMFEETGLKDSHIFFYCGNEMNDEYFEVHLDEKLKINQVYLVM